MVPGICVHLSCVCAALHDSFPLVMQKYGCRIGCPVACKCQLPPFCVSKSGTVLFQCEFHLSTCLRLCLGLRSEIGSVYCVGMPQRLEGVVVFEGVVAVGGVGVNAGGGVYLGGFSMRG